MAIKLVVQMHFGKYARGDEITDAGEITDALAGHEHFVTKVAVPDEVPTETPPE